MLFLLSFGLVNSNGYSFPSKPFQTYSAQEQSSPNDLCKQAVTDNPSSYLECDKDRFGSVPSGDSSNYHDTESSLQAANFRRMLSNEQESVADLEPAYHLLIDFSPPSILASLLFNTPLLDSKQHWTSTVSSRSFRLSGWKEGNIQYSHFRELLS
ncbi:hypothetical protein L1D16_05190 [Vibrio sp. Isolate31]|uniref:hypothetical protein n=1 Tax=unclassified Vibrio TaxID=2614977 RepID=UPI001EFE6EE8|nr:MULTISPECIES: hypothetical protein [unclassified Vibrio]MCG9553159.1 hypothetical protein [Vibrio sp. Isolate32]MCG9600328.1 hypothetical protein [Vibrio sp. Isolate31]